MKTIGILLFSLSISTSAFAGVTIACTWNNSDHGNPSFKIDIDTNTNNASVELIDGVSQGVPASYDCQIQPSYSTAFSPIVTLLCMGPQLAPGVGQIITTFMLDLHNKKAAIQNTLVRTSGLSALSSFPSVQCK